MGKQRGNGKNDSVFVFVGVYDDRDGAMADYEVLKQMHVDKVVGTYDAAVVDKDDSGKLHVRKHEKPTQHGAWSGLAAGAILGLIFPPGMLVGGIIGAATGGLVGHLREGMSRSDMQEIGAMLSEGDSALIVIGESKLQQALAKAMKRANRTMEKQINADAAALRRELDQSIDQAQRV